jgi:hypothetical protein
MAFQSFEEAKQACENSPEIRDMVSALVVEAVVNQQGYQEPGVPEWGMKTVLEKSHKAMRNMLFPEVTGVSPDTLVSYVNAAEAEISKGHDARLKEAGLDTESQPQAGGEKGNVVQMPSPEQKSERKWGAFLGSNSTFGRIAASGALAATLFSGQLLAQQGQPKNKDNNVTQALEEGGKSGKKTKEQKDRDGEKRGGTKQDGSSVESGNIRTTVSEGFAEYIAMEREIQTTGLKTVTVVTDKAGQYGVKENKLREVLSTVRVVMSNGGFPPDQRITNEQRDARWKDLPPGFIAFARPLIDQMERMGEQAYYLSPKNQAQVKLDAQAGQGQADQAAHNKDMMAERLKQERIRTSLMEKLAADPTNPALLKAFELFSKSQPQQQEQDSLGSGQEQGGAPGKLASGAQHVNDCGQDYMASWRKLTGGNIPADIQKFADSINKAAAEAGQTNGAACKADTIGNYIRSGAINGARFEPDGKGGLKPVGGQSNGGRPR